MNICDRINKICRETGTSDEKMCRILCEYRHGVGTYSGLKFIIIIIAVGLLGCNSRNARNNSEPISDNAEIQDTTVLYSNHHLYENADDIPSAYISIVDSLMELGHGNLVHSNYFLYDITGDNNPELWVKTGTCEADYEMNVYTTADGKPLHILNSYGGHTDYFILDGTFMSVTCNTGGGYVTCYHYDGTRIVESSDEFNLWSNDSDARTVIKNGHNIIDLLNDSLTYVTMMPLY